MKKRFLSILLVLCMMLPLMPTTAHAVDSGICGAQGDNVTWTISDWNSSKALVLNGSGAMYDYSQEIRPSYSELSYETWNKIHCVIINDGITHIGNYAFYGLNNISEVILPSNAVSIGEYSFSTCSLTNLVIPGNVLSIGDSAFKGNLVLSNLTIQEGVRSIGPDAFARCFDLTSVLIPSSVTTLNNAFDQCPKLTSISVHGENPNYSSKDGVVFNKAQTSLLMYPGGKTDNPYIVPAGVEDIEPCAFMDCGQLKSLTLPDGFTTIGFNAFTWSGLASITIPASITHIETSMECNYLKDVYYAGTKEEWNVIEGEKSWLTSATIHYGSTGPDDPGGDDPPSNEITFRSDDNFTVNVDDSIIILASLPNAETLQKGDITWSSSNESVAVIESNDALISGSTASATAVIRGVSEGTATITVNTSDGRTASCEVVAKVAPVLGDFRARANSASTCLTKGSTTELYIGYYNENQLDQDTKGYIYTLSDSNVLDIIPGAWSDKDGQRCQIIAKEPGSCILTITHPQNGESNILRLRVVDGNTGYTFNSVPTMTIEQGKTTNFYNHKGLVVDEFAYIANKDANGNIKDYTVTMTVYNTCNLYGAVSSFDAEGNLRAFRTIEKLEPMSTGFVENIKDLINRTGDLFSLINNSQYYSGESISKKTEIEITVPIGGYIEIANDASSAAAILVNSVGIVLEGTIAAVDLGTDANKLYDSEAEIVSDAVNNCLTKDYTYFTNKAIISAVKSQAEKELKNVNWNFDNYGDLFQSFIGCVEDFGIDIMDALAEKLASFEGVASISVNTLKACIPTGKLIDFLYDVIKVENWGIFCANFNKSVKDANGIYIYAPTLEDVYFSNGVKVAPSKAYDNNTLIHAYLVTDNNEFDPADVVFPTTEATSIGKTETYSITMYKNGQITQPSGTVTVRIPLSEEFQLVDKSNIKVYRHNDDGTVTDMHAEIIDRYAVFTTDHFSYYLLVEEVKNDNQDSQAYTVTFNANGGTVSPTAMITKEDNTLSSFPIPSYTGYTFIGWYTAPTGGTRITLNTVFDQDTTVYAQWTYDNSNIENDTPYYPGGSGTGNGSNNGTSYFINTPSSVTGGTVTVSPPSAKKGDTVTILVTPDNGYELAYITVTDKNGDNVHLTDRGDGKYILIMPDSNVTLDCAFKLIETDSPNQPTISFIDVIPSAYYYDAVAWAVAQGITTGTTATTFSPDAPCTRGQIVTFLWRAAGSPSVSGSNPFTDVQSGDYWYDAVLWAISKGITTGTSATTFSPNDACTRGQAVTFLYRNAGSPAVTPSASFTDVVPGAYYSDAVAWALAKNITNGTTATTFSPDDKCTRGQIVTFLYRNSGE